MIARVIASCFASCLAVSLLGAGSAFAADESRANPRAGLDFYLQTYGRVSPAEIPEVYAVFEKVRATADKNSMVSPQLIVVGDTKQASAFTLSDGTVVLSKKALAIMRESATEDEVRARIAFVLGHELAHLAGNDFWDNQISQALIESSTAREFNAQSLRGMVDAAAGQQKKELKADDLGFLYAALAGYDVDTLLARSRANEDFLSFWDTQAGRRNDPNYPLPAQRSGLLRLRLVEMQNSMHYFTFGARLMHFGRYRDAIGFLREFQRHYPGREVFNNLGYCYLRLAVSQLDPDYAYRYWLPAISELDSPLSKFTARSAEQADRGQGRMGAAARENLLQAVHYLELAIDKDANYAPSYVNLAVAQLLLGMRADSDPATTNALLRAKLAVGAALNLRVDDASVRMLAAIIDYESQGADRTKRTIRAASFANVDDDDAAYLYNLARLTSDDSARSSRYWQKLAVQLEATPKKLQALVCRRNAIAPIAGANNLKTRCDTLAQTAAAVPPLTLPVKLSRDLLNTPFTTAELAQQSWHTTQLNSGAVYIGPGSAVLAIDDVAVMAVLKPPSSNPDALLQCCSQPLEKVAVVNGTLWHYGRWIALVRDNRVSEVWVAN